MHLEAIPHATVSDDMYKGYYIPSGMSQMYMVSTRRDAFSTGATVIANLWYEQPSYHLL